VKGLDFGILEDGAIEIHRFFGLAIEPEEGDDFLHGWNFFLITKDTENTDDALGHCFPTAAAFFAGLQRLAQRGAVFRMHFLCVLCVLGG
jgi:hypothetical protein